MAIKSEGLLISPEIQQRISTGEADGQKPSDFALDGKVRLSDEMTACWSAALDYWQAFQRSYGRLQSGDSGATPTREQWILPLLRFLGFGQLSYCKSAAQIGGQTYFISHRDGEGEDGIPVHIEGANIGLDTRPPSGTPRISPQALVQEYLNRTEHLWGIVTNGLQFRLLRDSTRMSKSTYLEFDLEQIMEGKHFAEFQFFYRLVHRSRWPQTIDTASTCLLEQYYLQSIEEGGRVRNRLRDGVEEALTIFGNGFLLHPDNAALKDKTMRGELSAVDFYSQLLRLVYRFLFLMVAEDRKLAGPDPTAVRFHEVYYSHYSISRIRRRVERHFNPQDRYSDAWEAVRTTFQFYSSPGAAEKLGMAALDGGLFSNTAMPDLEHARLFNRDFLRGFRYLSLFEDRRVLRQINYGGLDVEELGSVYESLLDFHPRLREKDGRIRFELVAGGDRKTTGSYYTRPELVQELIKSALEPVMKQKLAGLVSKEEREKTLLSIRVCDPASGSGHFLLAAARRIGQELARIRTGEGQPPPSQVRLAVRDVIRHCIYGVDINPLATDLCRVALWLEGHHRGLPLAFLDHRIKTGNSLVGVDTIERLKQGIPDGAFKPVTGDAKEAANKIREQNRLESQRLKSGQMLLTPDATGKLDANLHTFATELDRLQELDEDIVDDTHRKQILYRNLKAGEAWLQDWTACHIWTAAFYRPLLDPDDPATPTQGKLMQYMNNPTAADGRLVGQATALSYKHRFFHWPLEFPEVARAGGFEVVLSNPPWERIKLQEKEFFAQRDPQIAGAPNKATRERLIKALKSGNPDLLLEFEEAKRGAEAESRFIRGSNRFPLTAVGDINLYAPFSELLLNLINNNGRMGIIVPTGLVTDDTTKSFFQHLLKLQHVVSIFDFENRKLIFKDVEANKRFCLTTISREQTTGFSIAAQLDDPSLLDDKKRTYHLVPDVIKHVNPNTLNCPMFRTVKDAELIISLHKRIPIFVREGELDGNQWQAEFLTLYHMTNDSGLFRTYEELDRSNSQLQGNRFVGDEGVFLPLFEAKLAGQYDHRSATFDGVLERDRFKIHAGTKPSTETSLADPYYFSLPRYWISEDSLISRIGKQNLWFIGFRNAISAVADSRSLLASILPFAGVANSMPLIRCDTSPALHCALLAALNSIVLDYTLKQKAGGGNLNYFILKQLPILSPSSFAPDDIDYISSRVLELTYTAYDLKPFAEDMGCTGPPFQWNEDRRALLKAELDAYYARLYGLTRDELHYILDPQDIYGPDFPGETFRVLKDKEMKQYGEYRTRRLVLEAWDRLERGELS